MEPVTDAIYRAYLVAEGIVGIGVRIAVTRETNGTWTATWWEVGNRGVRAEMLAKVGRRGP